jgi:dUTP pyrophosphatase
MYIVNYPIEDLEVFIKYHDTYNLEKFGELKLACEGDAGFDLRSVHRDSVLLYPGERLAINTGISLSIPLGYHVEIRPRSGLAFNHMITVLNTPGTIDSGYRGEIKVILINHSKTVFNINYGDKIAQAVFIKHSIPKFIKVDELDKTERGEGRYGHTGLQ